MPKFQNFLKTIMGLGSLGEKKPLIQDRVKDNVINIISQKEVFLHNNSDEICFCIQEGKVLEIILGTKGAILIIVHEGKYFIIKENRELFELNDNTEYIIGRGKNQELGFFLSDNNVSRTHVTIKKYKNNFSIIDHSTNGTMVNIKDMNGYFSEINEPIIFTA